MRSPERELASLGSSWQNAQLWGGQSSMDWRMVCKAQVVFVIGFACPERLCESWIIVAHSLPFFYTCVQAVQLKAPAPI